MRPIFPTTPKTELFLQGVAVMKAWCDLNQVTPPKVKETEEPTLYRTCAFYRDGVIKIWVSACAAIGMGA